MTALGFTAVVKLAKGAPWRRRRQMLLPSGTVAKVKQRYHWMNKILATKGPQGTVSHKTQISLQLLIKETDRLTNNIWILNPAYEEFVDLTNLLTTQVDNLHAVSHFKHESFSVLQYAQGFGTIAKESAKNYAHDRSYCLVPQNSMPLLLFPSWHLCQVSRFRTRWSEPWSSEDVSSSKTQDSQERNYQGQGGCFASSRVCHYHSPQTQALVDFAIDISEFPLQMTNMRSRSFHQRRMSN